MNTAHKITIVLATLSLAACGDTSTPDVDPGTGGTAGTGATDGSAGTGGTGGTAGGGGVGGMGSDGGTGGDIGIDVDAECRAFCQDAECGGGDPVECLAQCTGFAAHECGASFMDRVMCETALACDDTFRDCDPLADAWRDCFKITLPAPVEAACDIEHDQSYRPPGARIESKIYHAEVTTTDADALPFDVQICDRKLDWGHGVDGWPNYWRGGETCYYLTESGGFASQRCDVPAGFFDVGDDWTIDDRQYGSGARDVYRSFDGCTTHSADSYPELPGNLTAPTGIEATGDSVRVPCGFYTFISDAGGIGSYDARSGSVRLVYTVPTFGGF